MMMMMVVESVVLVLVLVLVVMLMKRREEKKEIYDDDDGDDNYNSIQFNSILVYLRANLTAQRPITKLAQVCRKKQKTYKQKEIAYIIIITTLIA
jgi:hypothetical protein